MPARLWMDIDYADLAYYGDGSPAQLRTLFDKMADAGFEGAIIDCFFNGQALYHSRRFPRYSNPARIGNYDNVVARLNEFDPLTLSFQLARERGIRLLPYVRLTDESFAPGHADPLFLQNPHYWYQTRCGGYFLSGVPCFAYDEVRALFMSRCSDLIEHGATELFIGTCRSHAGVFVPYYGKSGWDIWGFNAPIVEEYRRRYGVDIGKTANVQIQTSDEPRLRGYRQLNYEGTEAVDEAKFRALLGEGVDQLLRTLNRAHPDIALSLELSTSAIAPGTHLEHNLFTLDLRQLIADGVIASWMPADNWATSPQQLEDVHLALGPAERQRATIGAWLNDLLSPNGGDIHTSPARIEDIAAYLGRAAAAPLDRLMVHEAFFVIDHPRQDDIWQLFAKLRH